MRNGTLLLGIASLLTACATSPKDVPASSVYDPFEGFNRSIYAFNDSVDKALLEPAAKGYREITSPQIRTGISNFLTNLNQPVIFANTVLQLKPGAAGDTAIRFGLNSTLGLGGLFDPATYFNVPEHKEDFGQTLGVWGFAPGPYLMLPLMGPGNLRDVTGRGIDVLFNPLNYEPFRPGTTFNAGRGGLSVLSGREAAIEAAEILRDQPEPYIAWRRNYTQQREASIRDGQEEQDPFKNLPDFDAYDFGDD